MYIGSRIIFNKSTGKILNGCLEERFDTGLTQETINEIRPVDVDYVDLEYGEIDYAKYRIVGIDVETKQPILEEIAIPKTEEQQRIEELENQLLLMSDALI